MEQGSDLVIADRTDKEFIGFVQIVEIQKMGLALPSPPNKAT
jgi:hypothetical protein